MRENNIPDLATLIPCERDGYASGINRNAIVDYETSEVLLGRGAALAVDVAGQEFNFHEKRLLKVVKRSTAGSPRGQPAWGARK
jgi:hypothetical protein